MSFYKRVSVEMIKNVEARSGSILEACIPKHKTYDLLSWAILYLILGSNLQTPCANECIFSASTSFLIAYICLVNCATKYANPKLYVYNWQENLKCSPTNQSLAG